MSKQIHKDNKIIPIMQLALLELARTYGETDKIKDLKLQLNISIYSIISAVSNSTGPLSLPSVLFLIALKILHIYNGVVRPDLQPPIYLSIYLSIYYIFFIHI